MSKKVFTGEKQNLPQLAKDVEDWLRQQGFEVQSGGGDGKFLIQARKKSTWRSLLGNNQTIDVRIEGASENYSIDLDAGTWIKNLTDSGAAAVVAAVLYAPLAAISAVWSGSERTKLESDLWALKDASCPSCYRIGAAEGTGEKFVRAETITLQSSGLYQGTKVFTDTFECRFCSHIWDRGEKPRQVSLCPKCYQDETPASKDEKIITCTKTAKRNEQGQPVAEEVYKNIFRCGSCSHSWEDGPHTRLVEACPHCGQKGTREATGEHVFSLKKTDLRNPNGLLVGQQFFTNKYRCRACSHEWNDGQRDRLVVICHFCEQPGAVVFLGNGDSDDPTKYTEKFRCNLCAQEWHNEKVRTGYKIMSALCGIVETVETVAGVAAAVAGGPGSARSPEGQSEPAPTWAQPQPTQAQPAKQAVAAPQRCAVGIKGAVVTDYDAASGHGHYHKKCDVCGYVDGSKTGFVLTSGNTNGSFLCPKCKTMRDVVVKVERS